MFRVLISSVRLIDVINMLLYQQVKKRVEVLKLYNAHDLKDEIVQINMSVDSVSLVCSNLKKVKHSNDAIFLFDDV